MHLTNDGKETIPDKVLYQDFYESFRFSQGVTEAQLYLYKVLGQLYSELDYVIPDLTEPKFLDKVETLRAPKNHGGLSVRKQNLEFLEQWNRFSQVLSGMKVVEDHEGVDPYDRLAHDLLAHDLSYDKDPTRKRLASKDSPFQSYFRDYVVLKTPVSSSRYNKIIERMHGGAEERADFSELTNYHSRVGVLAITWEQRNRTDFSAGACEPVVRLCKQARSLVAA